VNRDIAPRILKLGTT